MLALYCRAGGEMMVMQSAASFDRCGTPSPGPSRKREGECFCPSDKREEDYPFVRLTRGGRVLL